MTIKIIDAPFDPWQLIAEHHQQRLATANDCGATAVFVGSMRDLNDGAAISNMTLEHYPGMTEHQLQLIIEQAAEQWQVLDTLIVHRVGQITPADAIVLVAVWAMHRGDAFDASRYMMEALKSTAPFWKKETREMDNSAQWVATNTDGYA